MAYLFAHTSLGFCWWDLLALILLAAVIIIFIVKTRKQKDEEKDLQDQIDEFENKEEAGSENPAAESLS